MTGNFYIDDKDAYSSYGVFVTANSYNELVAFPPLKNVVSNNWAEEDGEEFDLSAPVLDAHELTINFSYYGAETRFGAFVELLSDKAYHEFDFREIGRIYRLRLVSPSNLAFAKSMRIFSLRFSDDFPPVETDYKSPQSSLVPETGIRLDNHDFSDYGIYILRGSEAEIWKSPAVKQNLLRNIPTQSGVIYDGEFVAFQTKDVTLNCLMRASDLTEFWRNYDALLHDLVQPKARRLYIPLIRRGYPCYYRSCSVSKFAPMGKIWFQFALTLVFTSFRMEGYVGPVLRMIDANSLRLRGGEKDLCFT
jgi:hypothetical protein